MTEKQIANIDNNRKEDDVRKKLREKGCEKCGSKHFYTKFFYGASGMSKYDKPQNYEAICNTCSHSHSGMIW